MKGIFANYLWFFIAIAAIWAVLPWIHGEPVFTRSYFENLALFGAWWTLILIIRVVWRSARKRTARRWRRRTTAPRR